MKVNKIGILVFFLGLSLMMGPVSAETHVNSNMNNSAIQAVLNDPNTSEPIIFDAGTYNGIHLTLSNGLNLIGNGATIIGDGTSIFTITGTSGVTINNFAININSTSGGDGITGKNVLNCVIENNNITKGDDAINIFQSYKNLTIQNNRVSDMNSGRDGVSLVNHNSTNKETTTSTRIINNTIADVAYGIFLGGNFQGTVSGNIIPSTSYGMNITGEQATTNGILNANITYNTIPGIAMECPHVQSLTLDHNTIGQLSNTGYSILNNTAFNKDGNIQITNNDFGIQVTNYFYNIADIWENNTLNGQPYP